MRRALFMLLLAFVVLPLFAQERPDPNNPDGENLTTPPSWKVRLDRPSDGVVIGADKESADIWFVNMTPGWHVTTGPAAIFYHPASTAEGTYRAETTIHLFDPKGRNEAYGLFFGGQNLDGDDIVYDYFLLRNSGQFLIKRREGSGTATLKGWTSHDAVKTYGPDTQDSVLNTLTIETGEDEVCFSVNGQEVACLPRSDLHTDGVVGLRINHGLDVHVEDFAVSDM